MPSTAKKPCQTRSASDGIVSYILEHFDQKTKRNSFYTYCQVEEIDGKTQKGLKARQVVAGFNSIFAAASIPMAMQYYTEFKKQMADQNQQTENARPFSASAPMRMTRRLAAGRRLRHGRTWTRASRDFLEAAIADYNASFQHQF